MKSENIKLMETIAALPAILSSLYDGKPSSGYRAPPAGKLPPKAFIKGIGLVTKGRLTLQKVSFFLQKACNDRELYKKLVLSKGQDSASCLIRALAKSTAVTFLMGLSENRGHSNHAGISPGTKKMLIQQICESLNEHGRFVSIEEY